MAFAEKRGEWYRIVFRYNGKRYRQTLDTEDPTVADSAVCGVKRTLMLLEQKALHIPAGADVLSFILSGGQITEAPKPNGHVVTEPTTLASLKERYTETLSVGAVEESSLNTLTMHLRHMERTVGARFQLDALTLNHLQEHVIRRTKSKGMRGRPLSPVTIRKEIASFRAAWNWGVQAGLVKGAFPNKGLKFPKLDEKPPFQTWDEIQRQIAGGCLSKNQIAELWDCLYLRKSEIDELLRYLNEKGTMPWVYPLVCTAAYTGARRSELIRIEIADVDFDRNTILIREKKRSREKRTTRRASLTPSLKQVLLDWLRLHPGGPSLFAQCVGLVRSKSKRSVPTQLTRNEVHDHFKRSLADGKWKILRGLHLLRHSFISCLAAAGVDQRIIDELVGHQTPEQQKRYRHLAPDIKQEAVAKVFG